MNFRENYFIKKNNLLLIIENKGFCYVLIFLFE